MTDLEFDFRFADFRSLQTHMARRLYRSNRAAYGTAFIGVVLCAILITFAIVVNLYASRRFELFGAHYPRSILLLLILTLLGAVLTLIPAVQLRLTTLRAQVSDEGPLLGHTRLSIGTDGITVSRSLITTYYSWSAFQTVELSGGAVILPVDRGMGVIVPATAFAGESQRYEFVAELSKRIEAAKGSIAGDLSSKRTQ